MGGESWSALNDEFYAGDPAGYFRLRLNMLLLAAGAPDAVNELLEAGVRYEGLVTARLGRSSEERGDLQTAYLITESQALLHHVSEALVRLFLAHVGHPACPWLEVASLRSFSKFKKQAEVLTGFSWPEELEQAVPSLFLGAQGSHESNDQADAVEAITRLIRHLAKGLLDDSNLYNAVKHGVAVIASAEAHFSVATDEGQPILGSHGTSVGFLESKDADRQRTWSVTRRWVSIRRALWMSQLALIELDALWAVARARYTDADISGVQTVTRQAVEDGISGFFADRSPISRSSRVIAVEQLR